MYKIVSIIVTYNNRYKFVEKVVNSCFNEGVSLVIIVDNASEVDSELYFVQLEKNDNRIRLIRNDINLGSAGGFKVGISFLFKNIKEDFVWLLDDDNVRQYGSLNSVILKIIRIIILWDLEFKIF